MTVGLGPSSTNTITHVLPVRETVTRNRDNGVLMLHYHVASDSPGGATSNSKIRILQTRSLYTGLGVCKKNRIIIFCSLLDILANVEWPRLFAHRVYAEGTVGHGSR